ncbi:MAG: barstar family protein [Clostridia bacterium]|nr:barstar family protein [Clostridia bacterium]
MRIKILLFEQCKTKEDIQQLVKAGTDWIRTYPGERLHIQLAYLENLPETLIPDAREVVLFFNDLTETAENVTVEIVKRKEAYQHLDFYYDEKWELDYHEIKTVPMEINGKRVDVLTLDVTHCKTWWELHTVLKETFGFPNYYGKNSDALWDLLTPYIVDCLHIRIKGLKHLPKDLLEIEIPKILSVFDDVHREQPSMTFEIVD